MARLLLLRHGQIRANRLGHWHGSTDSPLTWTGRRQVARTARHIARSHAPAAIYSSPLKRCRDTAAAVAKRTGVPVTVVDELREYAIGEWEGMAFRQLMREHNFVEVATRDDNFAPPAGESLRQVAERIVPALERIDGRHGEDQQVLVVGHGAALAVALGTLLDGHARHWVNYHFANCSLTELSLKPIPYVNYFNLIQHLA